MTFLMMLSVILLFMLRILIFTSELQFELQDTIDWDRKWPVDFNAGKFELVLFDWSCNSAAIDVKIDGSVLEEKSYFKMLRLSFFFSKLKLGFYSDSFTATFSKKIGALIHSMKFFLQSLLFISINLPYSFA